MKTVKILSLTLFMSIFCTGMSFAHGQKDQRRGGTPEERSAKRIEMMKESLNLTPDQVTKLQTAHTQFAKEREQALHNNQKDIQAQREAYDAQVKSILTPEQYQKYQAQREDRKKGGDGKWSKNDKGGDKQGKCNKDGDKRQGKGKKK